MDKITHEILLSNWKAVIEQCSLRPEGQTVKQWLADNGINEKTYYYWQRRTFPKSKTDSQQSHQFR